MLHSSKHIASYLVFSTALALLAACGDYSMDVRHLRSKEANRPKERPLGVMTFRDEVTQESQAIYLNKLRGGYGLSTPVYTQESQRVNAVISKTKEFDWFTGVQMRFEF